MALALAAVAVGVRLAGQTFQENVQVDLVRVDLLVTDASGRPIPDLSPSEVHLEIDGHAQPISSLEPLTVEGRPGATSAVTAAAPSSGPASPPSAAPAAPAATQVPGAAGPAAYAMEIFVDETSSEQFNRNNAYRELSQLLDQGLPSGTLLALQRFDGTLHLECSWTTDLAKIRAALSVMQSHSFQPRIAAPGRMSPSRGGAGATASSPGLGVLEAAQYLERSVSGVIEALQRYPTDVARRRSLVLVTDGALFLSPTEVVEELVASSESSADRLPGPFKDAAAQADADKDNRLLSESSSKPRWFSQWTDATDLAMRRGIEIIPARSAALESGGNNTAEFALGPQSSSSGSGRVSRRGAAPVGTSVWAGAGMEQVAEITGGDAILSRSNFGKDLRKEVDQGSTGYVLTFKDPHAGDHRFHQIAIRVDRPKARLRFRHGYRAAGAAASLAERAIGALYVAPTENALGARAESRVLHKSPTSIELGVLVSYPPISGAAPDAAREVRIIGACATDSGKRSEPFLIRATGKLTTLPEGPLILVPIRVRLEPGTVGLGLAVRDEATGIVSTLFVKPEI